MDKIVQLPFAIPLLCASEKKAMLRGFLTGKPASTRDYSLISSWDRVYETGHRTYPTGVAFVQGNLLWGGYYGDAELIDPDTSEVVQTLPDGKRHGNCGAISISSEGNIYILNSNANCIMRFDSDYQFDRHIGAGLAWPCGVAASKRFLYISDTNNDRLVFWDLSADKACKFVGKKGSGDGEFNHPTGIALIENRFLAVADRRNNRVKLLKLDGTHELNIGVDQLTEPNDVKPDPDSNLLVFDTGHRRLVLFSLQGQYITAVMTDFFRLAGLTYCYIACCPETGRIAISDNDNHRIAMLRPHLY